MKKISLLLMPLMVVPFLTSCNAKCDKVSKEVFDDAIINKGLEYVQMRTNSTIYTDDEGTAKAKINYKISPMTCYSDGSVTGEKGQSMKVKFYSWLDQDKKMCNYIENDGTGWSEEKKETVEEAKDDDVWYTPERMSVIGCALVSTMPAYDEFNYTERGYNIEYAPEQPEYTLSEGEPDFVKLTIFFKNKKVTKFSQEIYLKDKSGELHLYIKMTNSYTYNEVAPKDPR